MTTDNMHPLRLRVPKVLNERMQLIARDLGCSVNAWAIQALAKVAKNHVPLEEFINQAPQRGKGAARHVVTDRKLSHFGKDCLPCGWPRDLPAAFWEREQVVGWNSDGSEIRQVVSRQPENEVANLRNMIGYGAKDLLNQARAFVGMDPVNDTEWTAAKAWLQTNP